MPIEIRYDLWYQSDGHLSHRSPDYFHLIFSCRVIQPKSFKDLSTLKMCKEQLIVMKEMVKESKAKVQISTIFLLENLTFRKLIPTLMCSTFRHKLHFQK